MSERCRMIVLGIGLGLLVAACGGGSGSTGLITSEGALIDEVRRTGSCGDFDGAPYCATDSPDATAPGGQRASVASGMVPTPLRTPSPQPTSGGGPSGSSTSAPAPTSSPAAGGPTDTPTPATSPTPGDARTVTATLNGFESGAACAVAARAAGSDDPWRTGSLVAVDDAAEPVIFPLPNGVAEPFDVALLCFAVAPATLAPELATLADASPTVVFVLPS